MSEENRGGDKEESEKEVKTSIRINRKIWEEFKNTLPKSVTMSKAIEDLIRGKMGGGDE